MSFSVVIPTYNRRHIIGRAIDSVFEQGVEDVEVLVVDDGSTDGTVEWLRRDYADKPVRVIANTGAKGPAGARNTGIGAAEGQYVALLDSDDAFLPGHLADASAAFAHPASPDVVFGPARYERDGVEESYMGPNFERKLGAAPKRVTDDLLTVFDDTFFDHLLEYGCWFNLSTVVMRREAARRGMNEQLRISEDYEFWLRLSRDYRFACLHRAQIRYALHDDNISFEADQSIERHAPRLLQALDVIRAYPGLTRQQRAMIDRQRSEVLFVWGYRCRLHGDWRGAARLHWRSLRLGKVGKNLVALAKLPAQALLS